MKWKMKQWYRDLGAKLPHEKDIGNIRAWEIETHFTVRLNPTLYYTTLSKFQFTSFLQWYLPFWTLLGISIYHYISYIVFIFRFAFGHHWNFNLTFCLDAINNFNLPCGLGNFNLPRDSRTLTRFQFTTDSRRLTHIQVNWNYQ